MFALKESTDNVSLDCDKRIQKLSDDFADMHNIVIEETNKKIAEMSEKIDHLTQLLMRVISNSQLSEEKNIIPNINVSSAVNSRRESLDSIPEEEEEDLLYRLLNPQAEDLFID
jgi:uncharacterized coiled-coil protein SlyX